MTDSTTQDATTFSAAESAENHFNRIIVHGLSMVADIFTDEGVLDQEDRNEIAENLAGGEDTEEGQEKESEASYRLTYESVIYSDERTYLDAEGFNSVAEALRYFIDEIQHLGSSYTYHIRNEDDVAVLTMDQSEDFHREELEVSR